MFKAFNLGYCSTQKNVFHYLILESSLRFAVCVLDLSYVPLIKPVSIDIFIKCCLSNVHSSCTALSSLKKLFDHSPCLSQSLYLSANLDAFVNYYRVELVY